MTNAETTAIQIGASEQAITAASGAILRILEAGRSDQVTLAALECFRRSVEVQDVTIRDCTFTINDRASEATEEARG